MANPTPDEVLVALVRAAKTVKGEDVETPRLADSMEDLGYDSIEVLEIVLLAEGLLKTFLSSSLLTSDAKTVGDVVEMFVNGTPFGLAD